MSVFGNGDGIGNALAGSSVHVGSLGDVVDGAVAVGECRRQRERAEEREVEHDAVGSGGLQRRIARLVLQRVGELTVARHLYEVGA